VVLSAGILLRIIGSKPQVQFDKKQASYESNTQSNNPSQDSTLNDFVLNFYDELNNGDYKNAFNRAFEISWVKEFYLDTNKNVDENEIIGFTDDARLISRAKKELGEKGERLSIFDINILNLTEVTDVSLYKNYQDVKLLEKLNNYKKIDRYYIADIEGQIYSSFCSHSKWHKYLVLVKFKDETNIKVLLNGAKNLVGTNSLEWFVDRIVGEYIRI
jgi:hypothetical protein